MIEKIISGGQTGVDRAALDVALELGLAVGGWVPEGRRAEDGRIPDHYPHLLETQGCDPAIRTERNVRDSGATVLLSHGEISGGTALACEAAARIGRPHLHLDLSTMSDRSAASQLQEWLARERPRTLNVAGPRASEDPEIFEATKRVLEIALRTQGFPKKRSQNP